MLDHHQTLDMVRKLPRHHQIAFGASCCERLLPNYYAFWAVYHWGNPTILEQALDEVWNSCADNNLSNTRFSELMEQCHLLAPDSENFKLVYTELAINAVGAFWCLLDFCAHNEPNQLVTVSKLGIEAVEYFSMIANWPTRDLVSTATDRELKEWINNSPLVRAEIDKQGQDASMLFKQRELHIDFLVAFRRKGGEVGVDPLKRGLVMNRKSTDF